MCNQEDMNQNFKIIHLWFDVYGLRCFGFGLFFEKIRVVYSSFVFVYFRGSGNVAPVLTCPRQKSESCAEIWNSRAFCRQVWSLEATVRLRRSSERPLTLSRICSAVNDCSVCFNSKSLDWLFATILSRAGGVLPVFFSVCVKEKETIWSVDKRLWNHAADVRA